MRIYLGDLETVWQERDATRALAETITETIAEAPGAFGLSEQFRKIETIAESLGIQWELSEDGFFTVWH